MRGTIVKKSNGRYYVATHHVDETGRRVQKSHGGYRTRKEAEHVLTEVPLRSLADVRRLEETPLADAIGARSTYDIFCNSAQASGARTALTFLRSADPDDAPIRWSFDELLSGAVPAYTRPDRPGHDLGPITAPYEPTLAQLGPLSSPPIPRTLGEFELLSELGRGGMGIVYRAWQPSLGREVALKRLGHIGNTKAEARFRREIKALGRVDHPNLIRIFTSGADPGGDLFYAMELVEGATLSAVSAAVPVPCRALLSRSRKNPSG